MENWLIYSILALIMWGFWGFFPKLATNYIDPKSALVFDSIGGLIVGIIVLVLLNFSPQVHRLGSFYAILTGICGLTGALFFLYAMSTGKVSVVVVITTLYPLITIPLAYFVLGEQIKLVQGLGMILALVAIIMMSI
jgi:transporter family protein